jgi:pyruvate formate lyase activating enzyme
VVVSNGYINPEPLKEALPVLDAFNIDLKGFNNEFYRKYTKTKLEPVLETIRIIAENNKHLEITNLVITGLNDNKTEFEAMVKWIAENAGKETPLHLSRYFPQYKMDAPATPLEKLKELYTIAKKHLFYVYLGNVSDSHRSATFCPNCGEMFLQRNRYNIQLDPDFDGRCPNCGTVLNFVT